MTTKWTRFFMLFVPTIVVLTTITTFCHGNVEEQYIGCYRDGGANNRAMPSNVTGLDNTFNSADMTLEKCLEKGVLARSTYVGIVVIEEAKRMTGQDFRETLVKFFTRWLRKYFVIKVLPRFSRKRQCYLMSTDSFYCFYGESYDRLGKLDDRACDMPCGGNARQKCGGKNAIKVFSVCPLSYCGLHDCSMRCDNCNTTNHLNRSLCSRVAVCVGGCQDGWKGTECNDDKDECNDRTHECEHQCHNTRGSYTCSCRLGFSQDSNNKNCSDNDECQEKTDNCQHHCTNTEGSFICSCREGYRLDSDRKSCNDIDECTEKTNECEQLCNNTEGNYTCSCKDGFALDSNNKNCSDINECSTNNGGCNHECINYEPGFNCSCYTDRYYHYNGTFCEDINECTNTSYGHNGGCHQSCDNAYGNYSCSCLPGYYLERNLKNCSDIDECTNASYGERGRCNQICNNAVSTYWCSCQQGYRLQADNKTCEDIDECKERTHDCGQKCTNVQGSFNCSCEKHFEPTVRNRKLCQDVNECLAPDKGGCDTYCYNNYGSERTCYCQAGYIYNSLRKLCEATIWATLYPVIGVVTSLLIIGAFVGIVVFCVLRRRRSFSAKAQADDTVSQISCDSYYSSSGQSNQGKNDDQMNETSLNEPNAIYATVPNVDTSKSPTRVRVSSLPVLLERIKNMPDALRVEFRNVPLHSDEKFDFAQKADLKPKNRFKNILPYNDNRVQLSVVGGDYKSSYINASFIEGYTQDEKIIASHGPTVNTLEDFWRMIWEYNVGVIVMVTKCQEEMKVKCEQYWPELSKDDKISGEIKVSAISADERPDYVIRKFRVSRKTGEPIRTLTQFQYIDWPDHGVPENATTLLTIRHAVRRIIDPDEYLVVHCSAMQFLVSVNVRAITAQFEAVLTCYKLIEKREAMCSLLKPDVRNAGVGRTGTYLAINYLLQEAANEGHVDVNSYVRALRNQRMHCVQTIDQYSFIFKALLEALILGETSKPLHQFSQHVAELQSLNEMTNKSVIETEFQMLQKMIPLPSLDMCSDAASEENKWKNRRCPLPMDGKRVNLKTVVDGRNDYINAVFLPSFFKKNAYISTQLPLDETVEDFWNMCIDSNCKTIVFLGDEDSLNFLPRNGEGVQFGSVSVGNARHTAVRENECIDVVKVTARRGADKTHGESVYANTQVTHEDTDEITVIQVSIPEDEHVFKHSLIFAHLYLQDLPDNAKGDSIVIMSRDSIQYCGVFVGASNICAMIEFQEEVDVFQTAYNIKSQHPHFFTVMSDYEQLYDVANVYAQQLCNTSQ